MTRDPPESRRFDITPYSARSERFVAAPNGVMISPRAAPGNACVEALHPRKAIGRGIARANQNPCPNRSRPTDIPLRPLRFDAFCDDAQAERMRHLDGRFDDHAVLCPRLEIHDERLVELERVHTQVAQVAERREAVP